MSGHRPTVFDAVIACLALCHGSSSPGTTSSAFLARLAENPLWADEEVAEVRRLVGERLAPDGTRGVDAIGKSQATLVTRGGAVDVLYPNQRR